MMFTHTREDNLYYCLLIQRLIMFSTNNLMKTHRNSILPIIWASLSPVKLTLKSNHHKVHTVRETNCAEAKRLRSHCTLKFHAGWRIPWMWPMVSGFHAWMVTQTWASLIHAATFIFINTCFECFKIQFNNHSGKGQIFEIYFWHRIIHYFPQHTTREVFNKCVILPPWRSWTSHWI